MSIRVAIFDDNKRILDSLTVLIEGTSGFSVAGAYSHAADAVSKILNDQPDVVLMDIDMPGTNGIQAVKEIKTQFPDLNIMMQTVFEDDDKVFESICNGASGYLLKNTPPAKILEAITEVYHGGSPMSPPIARKVLRMFAQHAPVKQTQENYNLTSREREVLQMLVEGNSYKMIADKLCITYDTVRSHMKKIYQKLHVNSINEAVGKALRNRLV